MQTKTKNRFQLVFLIILTLVFSTLLFFWTMTPDHFAKKIQSHHQEKLNQVSQSKVGLPYFTYTSLDPVWDKDSVNVVRIPRLHMVNQNNQEVNESLFLNKISIVGFIFTSCTGFCPLLVEELKNMNNNLPKTDDVQFILFSVDPEYDVPERLASFANQHGVGKKKNWIFLTGEKTQIYSLARKEFASEAFQKIDDSIRNFIHSEQFYVIDQNLYLRAILNGTKIKTANQASLVIKELLK